MGWKGFSQQLDYIHKRETILLQNENRVEYSVKCLLYQKIDELIRKLELPPKPNYSYAQSTGSDRHQQRTVDWTDRQGFFTAPD